MKKADGSALLDVLALTETLASRLCHDMAGLIATLSGTLEMVLEDGDTAGEAASLATEAAAALTARVKLMRAAWGGGDLEQASLDMLAAGLPGRRRLALSLEAIDSPDISLPAGGKRLALCLLLAACEGMPAGGAIAATAESHGFSLTMQGRNAAWDKSLGVVPVLTAAASARHMAAPMATLAAAGLGWNLTVCGARLVAVFGGAAA